MIGMVFCPPLVLTSLWTMVQNQNVIIRDMVTVSVRYIVFGTLEVAVKRR